jgi:hypothetical protein
MFSETRIGLYVYNVANILLTLVIQSATKSDTNFLIDIAWKNTHLVIGSGLDAKRSI